MTEKEKIKFIDYLRLKTRLKDEALKGTVLMLEGRFCDAETIASACVFNDRGYYMAERKGQGEGKADAIFVNLGSDILTEQPECGEDL